MNEKELITLIDRVIDLAHNGSGLQDTADALDTYQRTVAAIRELCGSKANPLVIKDKHGNYYHCHHAFANRGNVSLYNADYVLIVTLRAREIVYIGME